MGIRAVMGFVAVLRFVWLGLSRSDTLMGPVDGPFNACTVAERD